MWVSQARSQATARISPTVSGVLRPALSLAALAHAAAPGVYPTGVQELPTPPGAAYQLVLVTDEHGDSWTVRASLDSAAGAALEAAASLLRLLGGRLPYAVPVVAGTATGDDGTTVILYRALPGLPLVWRDLSAASPLARSVGTAIAALHDVDPRVIEEAGLPSYDADAYRARRLAALDRAASTGRVPAALLTRWERALEEVTLWKFATCVTHGTLEGFHVLADTEVRAIDTWERACVADPAEDFAALLALAHPDAFDTVLEAYSGARHDQPDPHLERRIRLSAELHRVTALLDAMAADDDRLIERRTAALARFADTCADDDRLMPSPFVRRRPPAATQQEPIDPADVLALDEGVEDETIEIPIPAPGSEDTTTKDTTAKDTAAKDTAAEDSPPQDAAPEDDQGSSTPS